MFHFNVVPIRLNVQPFKQHLLNKISYHQKLFLVLTYHLQIIYFFVRVKRNNVLTFFSH